MTNLSGCPPRPRDPIVELSRAEFTTSVKNISLCELHSEYNDTRADNISVPSDPCMHVLCTSIEPRLTTPLHIQFGYLSPDKSRSRDDVLATHFGEVIHSLEHPTPPSPGDNGALLEDIFASRSDDELLGPMTSFPVSRRRAKLS